MKTFFEQCERHWTTNPKKWKDQGVRIAYASQFLRGNPAADGATFHSPNLRMNSRPSTRRGRRRLRPTADCHRQAIKCKATSRSYPGAVSPIHPDATAGRHGVNERQRCCPAQIYQRPESKSVNKLFLALPPKHNLGIDEVANYLTRQLGLPVE